MTFLNELKNIFLLLLNLASFTTIAALLLAGIQLVMQQDTWPSPIKIIIVIGGLNLLLWLAWNALKQSFVSWFFEIWVEIKKPRSKNK